MTRAGSGDHCRVCIGPIVMLALLFGATQAWAARKEKPPRVEDIINIYLGIEHSQWLIGAVYYLATPAEREAFLALRTDEEAEAFVDDFWKRRDPEPEIFGNPALTLFEQRVKIADSRYREGTTIGSRTDRGSLFVLFGEPELIQYDVSTKPQEPDLEIWVYPKEVDEPLGQVLPQRLYFFAELEGRTVFYQPRASRRQNIRIEDAG